MQPPCHAVPVLAVLETAQKCSPAASRTGHSHTPLAWARAAPPAAQRCQLSQCRWHISTYRSAMTHCMTLHRSHLSLSIYLYPKRSDARHWIQCSCISVQAERCRNRALSFALATAASWPEVCRLSCAVTALFSEKNSVETESLLNMQQFLCKYF